MQNISLSRRSLFTGAAAAMALCSLPQTVMAALPRDVRKLGFYNTHTGENTKVTYFESGRYVPGALAEINHVLRDHRTGDATKMDPRLMDLLVALHRTIGSQDEFQVISGYRSPASNAKLHDASNGVAKKSLHMEGKAIDIRLGDRSISDIRRAALMMKVGGVGYYPTSDFVHVDTGNVRSWG